jgi:ribosomal protein S18 acetylase RimI-like enzyme
VSHGNEEQSLISVKNLVSTEPEAWFEINAGEKRLSQEEIRERASSLREKFLDSSENPENFFILFKDGRPAARIYRRRDAETQYGSSSESGMWLLQSFSVKYEEKDNKAEAFINLVNHVKNLHGWKELKIMLPGPSEDKIRDVLTESGFYLEIRKEYFRKELNDLETDKEEDGALTYRNLSQTGDRPFIEMLGRIQQVTLNSDAEEDAKDPGKAFNGFKDPDRFDPALWLLAYYQNAPAGMVLPGVERGTEPPQGFIQFIGVLPEYRNRGLGRILLEKGIRMLAESGAKMYTGSTDTLNIPMIKLFTSMGCRRSAVYDIWNVSQGKQMSLPPLLKS